MTPEHVTTRFCLIRHGETVWNAERRLQGSMDIELNAVGLRQAELAARGLLGAGLTVLYSSDLQRAWRTAEIIGDAIGLPPRPAPAMRERCYGVFEGLTLAEAAERVPEAYAAYRRRDPGFNYGTGESMAEMLLRVGGCLRDLLAAHPGGRIGIVLHGGVLDVIHRFVEGAPLDTKRDFPIPNAAFNWIAHAGGAWRIESWGDVRHLESLALDETAA